MHAANEKLCLRFAECIVKDPLLKEFVMKKITLLAAVTCACAVNFLVAGAEPAFATDAIFKIKATQIRKVSYAPYSCFGCLPPHSDVSTKIYVTVAPETAVSFSPAATTSGEYTLAFDASSPCVDLINQVSNKSSALRTVKIDFSNDDNFNNGSRTLDLSNASLQEHRTFLYCDLAR